MTGQASRRGFTLIELLVVMAIISILIGLLLPAVQKAREAAARTKCANNLHQLGIACHNYHDTKGALPPTRMGVGQATWAFLILPFIEQDNLFRQWNLSKTYYEQNETARTTTVPIYFCPTRRSAAGALSVYGDIPSWGGSTTNLPGALGDYACSLDPSGHDNPISTCPENRGAFLLGDGIKFSAFLDGLSNTLLIGEKHVPLGKYGHGWWDCSSYNGDYYTCFSRSAGSYFPLTNNPRDLGWKFGSLHTGVVPFCFADGHVQQVPVNINPRILDLLASRDDGQIIPDF